MGKRIFVAVIMVALILATLQVVAQPVKEAKANPWFIFTQVPPLGGTVPPVVNILSPKNNAAYASDTVLFSFTISGPQAPNNLPIGFRVIEYYLDDNRTLLEYCTRVNSNSTGGPTYTYSVNLTLPRGGHYFKVDATGVVFTGGLNLYDTNTSSATVVFSTQPDVSTTPFPISDASCIKILSPQPVNYFSNGSTIDIPLIVSINGSFAWMKYFLGDTGWWPKPFSEMIMRNVNITGNTTLTDVPLGSYVLTIDVNNTFTYATLVFNVTNVDPNAILPPTPSPNPTASPSPSPSPFPIQRSALEVVDVIKLRNYGGFYGAVYDSGTDEVYVANVDFNLVSVISATNRDEVAEVPVGSQPLGVVYDFGKGEIFVTNFASDSISVISDSNRTVVATIGVGSRPTALAYDSGKGEVFVANRDDNTISVISDSSNKVVATIPVGNTPYGVACSDNGKVYVSNYGDNTVSVISIGTNTVIATLAVGVGPYHAVYDSGKGEIFVTNNNSSSVSVISDSTNAVVANITVGLMPTGLAYDSGRGLVFVGNYGDNSVSVISDNTNAVVETVTSQQQPFALAYDSAHGQIFVAHMESWSVSVISDSSDPSSLPTATATVAPSASLIPTMTSATESSPTASPTPSSLTVVPGFAVDIAVVVIAAVVAGFLVYFAKRRSRSG